jgi:hypothetical protein
LYTSLTFHRRPEYTQTSTLCVFRKRKVQPVGRKKKSLMERELEVLSARVRFEVYKDVESIAKKEGLTLTQVVRRAVNEYVVKMKRPQAAA